MDLILIITIAVILVGAIILVIVGMRDSSEEDPLEQRFMEYAARGETASLEEIELSQPITDRIIFPLARFLGKIAVKFTPQNAIKSTRRKIELAGNPRGLDPNLFFSLRIFVALGIGGLLTFLMTIGMDAWGWGIKILIIAVFVVIGFYIPDLFLTSKIQRRQKEIHRSMPDALDLLTICVEAGLGFNGAMAKVYDKWDNELSDEFGRVLREIQLGKLRREALRDMTHRMDVPEMTSFVAAVIQSEQLGVSMAKVLRIQSDQMRVKRRQLAEEQAHKAPIKMLIPMAILIFPSICIVLMTPAFLMLMRSTFRTMFTGG